jgi:hypothetical protein
VLPWLVIAVQAWVISRLVGAYGRRLLELDRLSVSMEGLEAAIERLTHDESTPTSPPRHRGST